MAHEGAPAGGHTVTLAITREQALARERIKKFEGVLEEDISQISWKHQLPGEPIKKPDEDLAAPSMKVLVDILGQLKGTEEQLKGTQEQLKETLVQAARDKIKFQKSAPQEIVDDFKTIYAQYGMVIPRELLHIAGYILTPDQHKQVLAARGEKKMADD
ncbi:hypothetical protein F52700_9435 [Fusarium sp. NRRL 52700]|nr:hypothetical protein F52700_9435 [Fusarium sp. NRRL 52700]